MGNLLVGAGCLRILPRVPGQESTSIRKLMLILYLNGHRNTRIIRDASRRVAGGTFMQRATCSRGRTVMLVVE